MVAMAKNKKSLELLFLYPFESSSKNIPQGPAPKIVKYNPFNGDYKALAL